MLLDVFSLSIAFASKAIFFGTPDESWWAVAFLWIIRIVTFSLLLRTYIGPWALARMSNHIRARSISLRSIRGLYIRTGTRIWRIDRVSFAYRWSYLEGSSRLSVKVDGLHLEIGRDLPKPSARPRGHSRSLTLADFAPSPMARRLWVLVSSLYSLVEPFFRPLLRTFVVACLRQLIRWLPSITQALTFDLLSAVVTFTDLPGTQVVAETIHLHTALEFTQLEKAVGLEENEQKPRPRRPKKFYSMAAWRSLLTESLHRSWDRAWGKTQGTATISLKLTNVTGSTQSPALFTTSDQRRNFLGLPGLIDVHASMRFNPKRGTIDTHSLETTLNMGDCYVAVDVLRSLLDSLKEFKQSTIEAHYPLHAMDSDPTSPLTDSPPMSSALSPSSPNPSLLSPIAPNSPLLEAISASMRSRRRSKRPPSKLKDVNTSSRLSSLASAKIRISTIRLSARLSSDLGIVGQTYEAVIRDVVLGAQLSEPVQNSLHRQWLGKNEKTDNLESDAYAFSFSMDKMSIDRNVVGDHLRLMELGSVDFQVLVFQWPSPWLVATPFICGDPNAPLLAVRVQIARVEVTERVEFLQQLMSQVKSSSKQPSDSLAFRSTVFPVPRVALELHCGPICGRVIYGGLRPSGGSDIVEMRTDGFSASIISHFLSRPYTMPGEVSHPIPYCLPVQMSFTISVVLRSTFIRVRSNWPTKGPKRLSKNLSVSDPAFLDDPALLSMENLEIVGEGAAFGDINDDAENTASVDLDSMILDLHSSTDALSIELWHPVVIAASLKLLSSVPNNPRKATLIPRPQTPLLDRLPPGLSASVSLARFVVFVTAPDLNHKDDLELSRGFAFRTGISMQYCFLRSSHAQRFRDLPERSQTRHKLYLPEEQIVEAVVAARVSTITQNASAFLRILVTDLALRSAIANQYVPDDPLMAERDDATFHDREFLRIGSIKTEIKLSGKRNPNASSLDSCEVFVHIPYMRATFQLAHIYSVLLGLRTLSNFSRARPHAPATQKSSSGLSCQFRSDIRTVQIFWTLPKQRLVSRIDSISVHLSPNGPIAVRWNRLLIWVLLPSRINKWEQPKAEVWEELGFLQKWNVVLPKYSGPPSSISVEGDSAHVRIPFGFVLADLILDANITFKALRHLTRIAAAGRFMGIPTPESEAAKSMPKLTIRIRCLCLEASDDPFESKLAVIWRAGSEASKHRLDREDAFTMKVAAILAATTPGQPSLPVPPELESDYSFGSKHSVSIEEARQRLDQVHAVDWTLRHRILREKRAKLEETILRRLRGEVAMKGTGVIPNLVQVTPTQLAPPLFRVVLDDLLLTAGPPSFPLVALPDFMHEQGNGLPRDTQFSLLLPMHINFTLSSLRVTLRDYPMPLVNIPPHTNSSIAALEFDSDLVIAEEMGTDLSVDWIDCIVVKPNNGIHGAAPLSISVPKTIMPVKTYANPIVRVTTNGVTAFSWGVSYGPATQDLMRIVETLSSLPRDSSPVVGFWDKMRLVFHWSVEASFRGEVHLYMKGSRDPYNILGNGTGFVLSWQGNPKLLIGHKNDSRELIQVISDSMLIAIPSLESLNSLESPTPTAQFTMQESRSFRKVCAKFRSGVRFGVGFVMERSCGLECLVCSGTPFHRRCRLFDFRPHYEVMLERKARPPEFKGMDDSFNGFRSDFVHLSLSLASNIRSSKLGTQLSSSLHLTPKAFAHFWSWWALFDGVLSLPVRQGTYYPPRLISPKFGRHLATLKYRISVPHLFVVHAYIDDSRETWVDGVTPFVGVKAMIDELQVDMHQRDQEAIVPGITSDTTKILRRKPFYAAEVVLKGLDLRAMLATFVEPLKQSVPVTSPPQRSNYRTRNDLPAVDPSSTWNDLDDFVETDWSPSVTPTAHFLPVVTCPRFTYFKRNSTAQENQVESSKFGVEASHSCFLGKEASVPQVQISLALARVTELKESLSKSSHIEQGGRNNVKFAGDLPEQDEHTSSNYFALKKMIGLLEDYIAHLREADTASNHPGNGNAQSYYMPSDTVSSDEWAEFDNVYQVHCPKIFMNSAIRDIMMQYYYCSRARRGLEYHMATRAVKFIRDQAEAALATSTQEPSEKSRGPANTAQAAALALRKILTGDNPKTSVEVSDDLPSQPSGIIDPLNGWSDGVSLRKSHFCLLLKPQIVLRSEDTVESVCVVAAVQAKLQSFAIMDKSNVDDPVSGKVMSRSYTSLTGLQTFSPANSAYSGDGCVPLEVLIDFRCESNDFDRLVPQTDATFHYDKFNRLRLRNNVTSVARIAPDKSALVNDNHLQNQTDLIQIHIPRFTVTASDEHFQAISNIVTKLVLFSDAAHKTRLDKLETLLFTYDFTDLPSAANVVADLQGRLRGAMETERIAETNHRAVGEEGRLELLKLKAHIFLLAEELNFLFDAIKLAQDRFEDQTDHKSALLLHASSSEISWRMLDEEKDLLSKLAVRDIDFYWLSRQDSSTVNNLAVGDLQAFDGSRSALWTEILCKYDEPANHPLLKRGLFILAHWTVLAPVGGITIYESFELSLHPMRLQIDAKVGRRIMEYLWPARRTRNQEIEAGTSRALQGTGDTSAVESVMPSRSSLDSPRTLHGLRRPSGTSGSGLEPPSLRKLGTSRSFTDLRTTASESLLVPKLHRTQSSEALAGGRFHKTRTDSGVKNPGPRRKFGDAAEMKTRSSQKSFVLVRISSLNLLLSIMKEESFECRDARIRTRDLEYRNQTWSFEELVDQFIPSDMSWKGWVKMAFHQPLVPVLPVARELISKTKWIASSKGGIHQDHQSLIPRLGRTRATDDDSRITRSQSKKTRTPSPHRRWRKASRRPTEIPPTTILSAPFTTEPEPLEPDEESSRQRNKARMFSLFTRASSRSRKSTEFDMSSTGQTSSSGSTRRSGEERRNGAGSRNSSERA